MLPKDVSQADRLEEQPPDFREDRGLAVGLEVLPVAFGGGGEKSGALQPREFSLSRLERLMRQRGNFAEIPPVPRVQEKELQDLHPGPRSDEGAEGWVGSYTFCSHTYTEYIRGRARCQSLVGRGSGGLPYGAV